MSDDLRVYALKNLPPETIAVAFAKCSRSPEPFDKIAAELSEEKSADFNEKWVVNFGHSSIAEHAFLNIAIENVSLLAVENIESNRLGSYTEKSSRYQIYDRNRIYVPEVLAKEPALKAAYLDAVSALFDVYEKSLEPVKKVVEEMHPNIDKDPEAVWQAKIKSKWIDICRFCLPNCVLANLGASMNARSWEYAITKMLSAPLAEANEIGRRVKKVALEITPTLVKYADASRYYADNEKYLSAISGFLTEGRVEPEFSDDCRLETTLVDFDRDGEDRILAALVYKYRPVTYLQALSRVKAMNMFEKKVVFESILAKAKNIYEKPPRELEYAYYTFDILCDQGSYYDLKRNRVMTQTPQPLTASYGYFTPKIFDKVELGGEYRAAMDKAHAACREISARYPAEAQYITTKATARRFLLKMNLREAFYFLGLRSRKAGHFMYRRVAQMMYDEIARVHPLVARYIMVEKS